jgi:hypothetical protein
VRFIRFRLPGVKPYFMLPDLDCFMNITISSWWFVVHEYYKSLEIRLDLSCMSSLTVSPSPYKDSPEKEQETVASIEGKLETLKEP